MPAPTTQPDLSGLVNPRVRTSTSSVIRDLLHLIDRPGMLSMAGGLPAPELLPVERLAEAAARILAGDGPRALQYAPTEGVPELRAHVAAAHGIDAERVLVTTGSQQGLDLLSRALLGPGDTVVVEAPGYLGALQAFQMSGAELVAVPGDEDGLRTDELEARLVGGLRPTLVYVVTNFQNPSGATLSGERRRHLAALAERYGFLLVEDDPYGELRFRGTSLPRLTELTNQAVSLGTVSKILSPGLRVAWMVAPSWLVPPVVRLKQIADLHTSPLNQLLAADVLGDATFMASHVDELRRWSRGRADALVASIRSMPGRPLTVHRPDGGMFCWAHLQGEVTADELLPRALGSERRVRPRIGVRHRRLRPPRPPPVLLDPLGGGAGRRRRAARRQRSAQDELDEAVEGGVDLRPLAGGQQVEQQPRTTASIRR